MTVPFCYFNGTRVVSYDNSVNFRFGPIKLKFNTVFYNSLTFCLVDIAFYIMMKSYFYALFFQINIHFNCCIENYKMIRNVCYTILVDITMFVRLSGWNTRKILKDFACRIIFSKPTLGTNFSSPHKWSTSYIHREHSDNLTFSEIPISIL